MPRIDLKIWSVVIFTCLIGVIVIAMFVSMSRYSARTNADEPARMTQIILDAAVQCYALEGSYPPDLDYLTEKYGSQLDNNQYYYYYNNQIGNMLPEIQVLPKDGAL